MNCENNRTLGGKDTKWWKKLSDPFNKEKHFTSTFWELSLLDVQIDCTNVCTQNKKLQAAAG